MFAFKKATVLTHNPLTLVWRGASHIGSLILFSSLIAGLGCDDSKSPTTDPLADVLQLANAGDLNSAIQRFVSDAPENWIESTFLEDLRMSEATFAKLDRNEKTRMQRKFIDRVEEIKRFARSVIERANEANQKGDKETAERNAEAVRRLGRQLRDFDTVLVFQQMGKAISEIKLSE